MVLSGSRRTRNSTVYPAHIIMEPSAIMSPMLNDGTVGRPCVAMR